MVYWAQEAFFYHIYPLGLCAAPQENQFSRPPEPRLRKLHGWLDHLQSLGITALYLGPCFQSTTHGYDTADYYHLDRRLGTDEDLVAFGAELARRGIRLVPDGVFHHVGRDFWAFRDLREKGEASPYRDWFAGVRFGATSPHGDPFVYDTWRGHSQLVKLNTAHPGVREHLFGAVASWIHRFGIAGLRLDVADCLDFDFMQALGHFTRSLRPDFFLLGEVIHGNYNNWLQKAGLDSVTNYEAYKGLYSAHNDRNLFEIAHTLGRQFGPGGLYREGLLYNFLDNHDVNRIASALQEPAHFDTACLLLFTMPGIPSFYYGSEWGIAGKKQVHSDLSLRPALELTEARRLGENQERVVRTLAGIRRQSGALKKGDLRLLHTASEQLVFQRQWQGEEVIVAVNITGSRQELTVPVSGEGRFRDLLNPPESLPATGGRLTLPLYPHWGRILCRES